MSVSQYPTDCLWVVPDCRSAQDSRLAAAIVCRILATAAALVGGTGGFSTDRRRVTAAPHFYFVLQIVFIGWIEPSPRTNQKQSESPGPCSNVEAASLGPSLAPRASARLFLISAITFCKGGVVTRTGSICRDIQLGPTWCAFARSPCSAFLKLVCAEVGESPAPPPSSAARCAAGASKQGSRLSIQAANNI